MGERKLSILPHLNSPTSIQRKDMSLTFVSLATEYLIEFENIGGNHVHAARRDFDGDFGRDLIKEHLSKENH